MTFDLPAFKKETDNAQQRIPTQNSFTNKHTEQAPIPVKLCSRDFQKSKQLNVVRDKNISAEIKLASSPLNHVNQKYKVLGNDGAHHKQKSLHMSKANSLRPTGRFETLETSACQVLNLRSVSVPWNPGICGT